MEKQLLVQFVKELIGYISSNLMKKNDNESQTILMDNVIQRVVEGKNVDEIKDKILSLIDAQVEQKKFGIKTDEQLQIAQIQEKYKKKIKKITADFQFQNKKLIEDHFADRVNYDKMKNKQIKNLKHQIDHLRKQIHNQNKIWIQRFDIRNSQHKEQVEQLKESYQAKCNQLKHQLQCFWIQKINKIQKNLTQQLNKKTRQYQELIDRLKNDTSTDTGKLKKEYQDKINQLINLRDKEMSQLKKMYEDKLTTDEHWLRVEKNNFQRINFQYVRTKQKMFDQIFKLKKDKQKLENLVLQLEERQRNLFSQLEQKNEEMSSLMEIHTNQIEQLKKHSQQQQKLLKESLNSKLNLFLQDQLQFTQKIDHSMKGNFTLQISVSNINKKYLKFTIR